MSKRIVSLKLLLCILIGVLFLLSLLPLFYIAQYALPMGDDLLFGRNTSEVWRTTGSFGAVLKTAAQDTVSVYNNWQGTYVSIFLMCLQPAVFSVSFYAYAPVFMLLMLIGSTMLLSYVLLVRYFRMDKAGWFLITFTGLLMQIQLLPDMREGFFFYNSAVLYTLSYCFALLMFGILSLQRQTRSRFWRIVLPILAVIFTALLAGGAFSLLLPVIFVLLIILFYDCRSRDQYRIITTAVVLFVLIAGAALSIMAPGNALRTAFEHSNYGSHGLNLPDTILHAVLYTILFIARNTGLGMIVFIAIFTVFVWRVCEKNPIRFLHPLIVGTITFGFISMQFAPTFYTLSSSGHARLQNVVFFSLFWFWAVNSLNAVGWLKNRHASTVEQALEGCKAFGTNGHRALGKQAGIILVLVSLMFFGFAQRDGGIMENPSVQSVIEVMNGTAAEHADQTREALISGQSNSNLTESAILP